MNAVPADGHLDAATAHAYAERLVDPPTEFSVERHLLECARCRQLIAAGAAQGGMADASPERLQSVWSGVSAQIDTPSTADNRVGSGRSTLKERLKDLLSSFKDTLTIRRSGLQAIVSAVAVVSVAGLSAVFLGDIGPTGSRTQPQSSISGAATSAQGATIERLYTGSDGQTTTSMFVVEPGLSPYIAVLWTMQISDPNPDQNTQAEVDRLKEAGIRAQSVRAGDVPFLRLAPAGRSITTDSILVYAGPFETLTKLEAFCQSWKTVAPTCLAVEPDL